MASPPEPNQRHSSTEVSFRVVHDFVRRLIGHLTDIPLLGTPAWCELDDDDERKLAAVLDGGQHHALRLELNQTARAEAGSDVAGAADWKAIAQEAAELAAFRKANPWSKRVAS